MYVTGKDPRTRPTSFRQLVVFLSIIASCFAVAVFAQDTLMVYGGSGMLEGKFQTATGEPDRQGWIGVDLTQDTESFWQTDIFNCANLDSNTTNNHAWWCGAQFASCDPDDPPEGYGNSWNELLGWHGTVLDPGEPVTVTVRALMNVDSEPGYDFVYLQCICPEDVLDVWGLAGFTEGLIVRQTFTLQPEDYTGVSSDTVHLRWCFVTDGAWSDEDCIWPSAGAVQIDLIEVFFDQGAGPVQIGDTETCEPGSVLQWSVEYASGVGDFSQVWPLLDDLDPDHQNDTPQFAFIDDGIVVPGVGPTFGIDWTYGPNGYTIHGDVPYYWENEIWSPPISLEEPIDELSAVIMAYDVYHHGGMCQPQYDYWRIRSRSAGAEWAEWQAPEDWVFFNDGSYERIVRDVLPFLESDAVEIQIALGLAYRGWCWIATGQTPAPYYDNVAVGVVSGATVVSDELPSQYLSLQTPIPNPFNPATEIKFVAPDGVSVSLVVYDLTGRCVRTLINGVLPAGEHTVRWDGRDDSGGAAAAGAYLFRLQMNGRTLTQKGMLVR